MSPESAGPPSSAPSPAVSVWGRVLDAAGTPLPGAKVYWVPAGFAGRKTVPILHAHKVAHSDETGAFFAPNLPAGTCILVADFENMGFVDEAIRVDRGTLLTLPPPAGTDDLILRFPVTPQSFGRVHGTVLDSEGAPYPGLPVLLVAPDRGSAFQRVAITDAAGNYMHPWLLPGKYVIAVPGTVRHLGGGQPFEVLAGKVLKVGLRLHPRVTDPSGYLGTTYSVEMRVEDPLGAPVVGAVANIQVPNHFIPPIVTGADGMVRARDLPVRPVAVGVQARGFRPMGLGWQDPDPDETEFGGTLSLHRLATCSVRVVDAATGLPLRHANILLVHEGNNAFKWTGTFDQTIDAQKFEIIPGEVQVQAACPGYRTGEARAMVPEFGLGEDIVVELERGVDAPPA